MILRWTDGSIEIKRKHGQFHFFFEVWNNGFFDVAHDLTGDEQSGQQLFNKILKVLKNESLKEQNYLLELVHVLQVKGSIKECQE